MKFISERSDRNVFFWAAVAILIAGANVIITSLRDADASLAVLIAATVVTTTTLCTMYWGWVRITSIGDRIGSAEQRVSESLKELESRSATSEAIDKKKEAFLNIANISFHFANNDQIAGFYNDYFQEPTIEQIVSEITGETTGEAKVQIPKILESKVGGKDLSKWISTIKVPNVSVAEMFRRYQRETIRNNQVTLGLELVDIDLSHLGAFEDLITKLRSDFDVDLDENVQVELQRATLKKNAAEQTILRLENASGWILMEGRFTLSEVSTDLYRCDYEHPVSEYLTEYLTGGARRIILSVILPKDGIEPSVAGNYAQSVGRSIPLKVYGKVWRPVDRKGDVWELQISPLAIY